MAKLRNPSTFTTHFKLDKLTFARTGALDPTLQVDTRLFVDPMLLSASQATKFSKAAETLYSSHFGKVIRLLKGSKRKHDAPWKAAFKLLSFPELKWTCLGYGGASISGSGSGNSMTERLIQTAKEIIDLGVEDPDLFVAMALFETGVGPDRISDMTSRVILPALIDFTRDILSAFDVVSETFTLPLLDGNSVTAKLPRNPFQRTAEPVLLLPKDILRRLPIVTDWDQISDAVDRNRRLRRNVNWMVGRLWEKQTLKNKSQIRALVTQNKQSFEEYLSILRGANGRPYDFERDPDGVANWLNHDLVAESHPLKLSKPGYSLNGLLRVASEIIEQFKFLVEKRRFSNELYDSTGKPRKERACQRLFFIVAYSYCKANNLDVTPEAETDNGPVDFKFSQGFDLRVVVEIKLSKNNKLLDGYEQQLSTYAEAEETSAGLFVVVEVGNGLTPARRRELEKLRIMHNHTDAQDIFYIDGKRRVSASKLKRRRFRM